MSLSSFERHPLQVRHKQDWGRGFILLLPQTVHCLNKMLAVMLLSQHRVSSFKTVRSRAPCGARCIGHNLLDMVCGLLVVCYVLSLPIVVVYSV